MTDREITVVGNPRVYKALRGQMELIYQELQRLAVDEEVPPDLLETLQMVALTLNGLKAVSYTHLWASVLTTPVVLLSSSALS